MKYVYFPMNIIIVLEAKYTRQAALKSHLNNQIAEKSAQASLSTLQACQFTVQMLNGICLLTLRRRSLSKRTSLKKFAKSTKSGRTPKSDGRAGGD
jgi:hypothetical protein